MPKLWRAVPFVIAFALGGCFAADDLYGRYWMSPDANSRDFDMTETVVVASNAPSISNSFYKYFDEKRPLSEQHLGIDIIADLATPVIAPADGVVVKVFTEPFYGRNIIIEHTIESTGEVFRTHYKHLHVQSVAVGDAVQRGEIIGAMGRTGALAGGLVHLHFEVHQLGTGKRLSAVDPHGYWRDGIGIVSCFDPDIENQPSGFWISYPVICRD